MLSLREVAIAHSLAVTRPVVVPDPGELRLLGQCVRPAKGGGRGRDRAIRLNPTVPPWAAGPLRSAYFFAGRYEDAARLVERKPAETRSKNDLVARAASYGALGRAEQARAALGEALTRFPGLTIEGYVADTSWAPAERERLVETMRAAGFPLCATSEDLKNAPTPVRLPGLPSWATAGGLELEGRVTAMDAVPAS